MKIYIDEGGLFLPAYQFGTVCALASPHRRVEKVSLEILALTEHWPKVNGELKGGKLNSSHLQAVVEILHSHGAILRCCAFHVSANDDEAIARHKHAQCEGFTENLTAEHKKRPMSIRFGGTDVSWRKCPTNYTCNALPCRG